MEQPARSPSADSGGPGDCKPPPEPRRTRGCVRSSSSPAAAATARQEASRLLCPSDAEGGPWLSRQASSFPQTEMAEYVGEEKVSKVRVPVELGHASLRPSTVSLTDFTSSGCCRAGVPASTVSGARSAPIIQSPCTALHSDSTAQVIFSPRSSSHVPFSPLLGHSSSLNALALGAAIPRSIHEHEGPPPKPQMDAKFDFKTHSKYRSMRRCISDVALRRPWPCGERTPESAPLLLQLTSPSSSTAWLQLEAIWAQTASVAKLPSYRAPCPGSSEAVTSTTESFKRDIQTGTYPPFSRWQPRQKLAGLRFFGGRSRKTPFLSGGCAILRSSSAPASVRRKALSAGAQETLSAAKAGGGLAVTYNSGSTKGRFGVPSELCNSTLGSHARPMQRQSQSWAWSLHSGFRAFGSRTLPDSVMRPWNPRSNGACSSEVMPLYINRAGRLISGHPALSTTWPMPYGSEVHGSQIRNDDGHMLFYQCASPEVVREELAKPSSGDNEGEAPTRTSVTFGPQRTSAGGMEGFFVKGVQSCIRRLVNNFPPGFELHNGYGSLVVPDYWTSDITINNPPPRASHLGSSDANVACKAAESPSNEGISRHGRSLQTEGPNEFGSTKREILQGFEFGALNDAEHLRAVGPEVVFSINALSAEASAAAASRYYTLEGLIGRGAHGAVFRAKRLVRIPECNKPTDSTGLPDDGRVSPAKTGNAAEAPANMDEVEVEEDEVALKIVDLDGALRTQCTDASGRARYIERVLAEANILAAVDHEHIVKFYEAFQWPPCYIVLVTEYLPGGSLRDLYKSSGPLPEAIIALVLKDVTKALEYLHTVRQQDDNAYKPLCIHRDIKAANILLTESGRAKLIDFGISSNFTETDTEFAGTPQWMAPEVAEIFCLRHQRASGKGVDAQVMPYNTNVDIWSLGITAYELAMGCLPWPHGTKLDQLLHMIAYGPAPRINLNEGFEKSFCYFVEKCLRKSASERGSAACLLLHDFLAKFCPNKRPQSHQELKEIVETFNGKRQASILTTMVRYFNFWGRKSNGSPIATTTVAKRRMPIGRLENWGSCGFIGTTKSSGTGATEIEQQKTAPSLISSSQSVIFPEDTNGSRAFTSPFPPPHTQLDRAADAQTSISLPEAQKTHGTSPSNIGTTLGSDGTPADQAGSQQTDWASSSAQRLPFSPREWPVSASGSEACADCPQDLHVTRQAGNGESETLAGVPVDTDLTNAIGKLPVAQASVISHEESQGGSPQDKSAGCNPQSSQSFFSFFFSAFQGSAATKPETTPTTDAAAAAAELHAVQDKINQDAAAPQSRSRRSSQDAAANLPTLASGTEPQKVPLRSIPLPQIAPGYPLPRRFRKTRDTGTRRRSKHREAKASLSRGADRFFGLFRRVGMASDNLSAEAGKTIGSSSSGNTSDAAEETGLDCVGSLSSDNILKYNKNEDRTPPCRGEQLGMHDRIASKGHNDDHNSMVPTDIGGPGNLPVASNSGGAELKLSQDNHDVNDTSEGAPPARCTVHSSGSRTVHFGNLLETPTRPATGVPFEDNIPDVEDDPELVSALRFVMSSEPFSTDTVFSERIPPALAPTASLPENSQTAQSCNMEHIMADERESSSDLTYDPAAQRLHCPPSMTGVRPDIDGSSGHPEEAADSGDDQHALPQPSLPPDRQTANEAESERGWLPGPSLYKRFLDGIVRFVEETSIRRPVNGSSSHEPLVEVAHFLSQENSSGKGDCRDTNEPGMHPRCEIKGPNVQRQTMPGGQGRYSTPQPSWLWNFISKDRGSLPKSEARDPSSVAASYLSDAVPYSAVIPSPQGTSISAPSEICAPEGSVLRHPTQRQFCQPAERLHAADITNASCLSFGNPATTKELGAIHHASGRAQEDFHGFPTITRHSLPAISNVDRMRFTTLAEGLEQERHLQHAPFEHLPPDYKRAYYLSHLQRHSFNDPLTVRALQMHLHDHAIQHPIFMGRLPGHWILPHQCPPDFTRVLGFNGRDFTAFVPNLIPAPVGWEEGHSVSLPIRWHDGTVLHVPAQPPANLPYDVQGANYGPHTQEHFVKP